MDENPYPLRNTSPSLYARDSRFFSPCSLCSISPLLGGSLLSKFFPGQQSFLQWTQVVPPSDGQISNIGFSCYGSNRRFRVRKCWLQTPSPLFPPFFFFGHPPPSGAAPEGRCRGQSSVPSLTPPQLRARIRFCDHNPLEDAPPHGRVKHLAPFLLSLHSKNIDLIIFLDSLAVIPASDPRVCPLFPTALLMSLTGGLDNFLLSFFPKEPIQVAGNLNAGFWALSLFFLLIVMWLRVAAEWYNLWPTPIALILPTFKQTFR